MTTPQTDIKIQLADLVSNAFEAFCNDISGMFGVEMTSHLLSDSNETAKGLEKKFKKLSAIVTVSARGVLDGNIHLVFDREGLFTLAGTIVMLPEQRIQNFRKTGSVADAEELYDAVGETGNLLVGSWDRIFREELEGHVHFLQTGTFIGNPWADSKKEIDLPEDEEFLFFPCEITLGSFPAFSCGVIFPEAVFQKTPDEDSTPESEEMENSEPIEEPENEPVESPKADVPAESESQEVAGGVVSQTIQKMVQSLPIIPPEQAHALLNVCAKDIMEKEILWGKPEDSVQHAMEKMQQADTACMMVGSSGLLEGIVTWIDIAEAVSVYLRPVFSKWHRPADDATLQIRVKVIMTRPVRTIKPQTSLAVVMEDMCQHRLRCLPVVNEEGKTEGVVTTFDIFKLLLKMAPGFSITEGVPQSTVLPE